MFKFVSRFLRLDASVTIGSRRCSAEITKATRFTGYVRSGFLCDSEYIFLSQHTIIKIEHSEVNGTITLNSLRKAAEAIDCCLVYAVMPRTSLEDIIVRQARKTAEKEFFKIDKTMALEDQSVDAAVQRQMIEELAQELIDALKKELWNC